jgi:hypothetical protein
LASVTGEGGLRSQRDFIGIVECAECTRVQSRVAAGSRAGRVYSMLNDKLCAVKARRVNRLRPAGYELKLFGRQGEAVAPSAGRGADAKGRSAVQRQKTALLAGNWQMNARKVQ